MKGILNALEKISEQAGKEAKRYKRYMECLQEHSKELTPRENVKMAIATLDFCEVCEKICEAHGWDPDAENEIEDKSEPCLPF